jgi:hypothetical protein
MSLQELRVLCVERFAPNPHRETLFNRLQDFVGRFHRADIPCEMWINGSFLTSKVDPSDVDLSVKIDLDVADNLSVTQRLLVDEANKAEYIIGIDSFVFTAYPRDHPLFDSEINERDSWAEQWGREHSQLWLKGIAVIRLGETSVGLRIRR